MKPTDIRINNWVLYDGLPNKILSIIFPQPTDDRFDSEWVVEINPPDSFNVLLSELEPVPLTEEWMERLGFEEYIDFGRKTDVYDKIPLCGFSYNLYSKKVTIMHKGNGISHLLNIEIKYVHQLQQLFHALTQQELT
jgi:hypothetical protein